MRYLVLLLGVFFGDNYIKNYIEENLSFEDQKELMDGKITVVKHHNKGAVLNFMEEKPKLVAATAFFAMCFSGMLCFQIFSKGKNGLLKLGIALLTGGGASNLYDRLKKGYVVDYFIINWKRLKTVIFNLSDFAIFLGGLFITLGALWDEREEK